MSYFAVTHALALLMALSSVPSSASSTAGQPVIVPKNGMAYFASPTYPRNYEKNTTITYNIVGPEGFGILFDIVDFELCSIGCGYGCFADYVIFSDLIDGKDVEFSSAMCGEISFPDGGHLRLPSRSNNVTVKFITGHRGPAYRGFNFSATALDRPKTSIDVPAKGRGKVYFTSYNYPLANYYPNFDTVYFISGPNDAKLEFDTVEFSVEGLSAVGAMYDYVNFAETNNNSETVLIAPPFYGNNGPKKLRSNSNYAMVYFRSDKILTYPGFNISVQAV